MSGTLSEPLAPRIWAIVPAAGVGARMGAECPKQYLPLAGQTILEKTLERLLAVPNLAKVLVALSPSDGYWSELGVSADPKITAVDGGKERADSVLNALYALQALAADDDWVLVHDAARPCVTVNSIGSLIRECQNHAVGGILGVPVADTLKRVASGSIEETIDRSVVWQAQTPQLFRYQALLDALESALAHSVAITDEASAIEYAGLSAKMIEGCSDNIKVTRPADLALAEMILNNQSVTAFE